MKKIIIYILCSLCLTQYIYAQETKTFSTKTGYKAYKENVNNFCKYYYKGKSELIYRIDETKSFTNLDEENVSAQEAFKKSQQEYKDNLDAIYSCANSFTTYKSIQLIREKLIKKNPELNSRLQAQLKNKEKQIEAASKKLSGECKISSSSEQSNFIKKSVLDQTSYELCRYTYYLEYLYDRANKIETQITDTEKDRQEVGVTLVVNRIEKVKENILAEQQNILRIFPIAYKAYVDYENNIGPHILLELIKEDYVILREQLHKTLNPLSLLGYKLKNAMKK